MRRLSLSAFAFVLSTLAASPAAAHIALTDPPARRPDQKVGPCGLGANDPRGPNVTVFKGGETITVRWTETVDHPGHYRISFDPDGQDDFVDPAAYDDYYTNDAVLVDQIPDKAGSNQMYEQQVTLPRMSCDNCTLQLVQVMTDKPPYQVGTNDLYYQCADIVLVGEEETTGGTSEGTTGGTSEGTSDATSGNASGSGNATEPTSGAGTTGGGGPGGASGTDGGADDETGLTCPPSAAGEALKPRCSIDEPDSGCSCRSGGPGGASAGLLALLGLLRRRRRGARRCL
ncbi:MAG TPA: SCE4755 family polysaccharide monooxygenase-like protein [Nannocystis sp.]